MWLVWTTLRSIRIWTRVIVATCNVKAWMGKGQGKTELKKRLGKAGAAVDLQD